MTISSTIGYNLPSVGRPIPVSARERSDWLEPDAPPRPGSEESPKVTGPSRTPGLLSSINIAEVLKLTDAPPVDVSTLTKPLNDKEFLSESIKRSQAAYITGGDAVVGSLTERYTQKDVDTIRAATGYNLVVTNNLTTVVDDNGNPPPADVAMQVMNLAGSIEMARFDGGFKGEMTPDYLKDLFAGLKSAGMSLPSDWLAKALDYIGATNKPASKEL